MALVGNQLCAPPVVKHGYPENGWAWLAISAGAGHDNTTRTAAGPKQFPLAGMSWNSFCGPLSWELLSFLMVTDALDTWNLARSAQWLDQRPPLIGPAGSKRSTNYPRLS